MSSVNFSDQQSRRDDTESAYDPDADAGVSMRSAKSRFTQSKTGGQITLEKLRNEDKSTDPKF